MDERLNQMNAVLQAMQKTLQCNICLDLLNNPLTTKCGHSFCAECIQQVVKGPRSSAQCPLCLAHITRRSLGHNNKITSLVVAVRKIINSIKKDCCFEVTPSKYRPRPRPTITAEDDDSENEENDEPRRGTRKRGVTDHYNPEVHIPKPRARSTKQRILTCNGGQELSLHTDGKPQAQRADAGISNCNERVIVDVISQEHSYSSPTKQEPLERTSLIPSLTRGKGARGSGGGLVLRGRGRPLGGGTRGGHASLLGKPTRNSGKPVTTHFGKKEINSKIRSELLSVGQEIDNTVFLPGETLNCTEDSTKHLSEKLGREKSADKVAKWIHTSSEIGFRIGASLSSDALSKSESESTQVFKPSEKSAVENQQSTQMLEANKSSVKKVKHSDQVSSSSSLSMKTGGTISSSHTGSWRFFKSKDSNGSSENELKDTQNDIETQIFNPAEHLSGTPSDPYNFIPSQKTPKTQKVTQKRGRGVKSRTRGGGLSIGRGRVRGRGRDRVVPVAERGFDKTDDSIINTNVTIDSTFQKQSTPVAMGTKLNQNVNLSVITPLDLTTVCVEKKQMESVIVSAHDDDDDDNCLPDSCPVSTKNEFDVLVSEVKDIKTRSSHVTDPSCDNILEADEQTDLIFVTPAQDAEESALVGERDKTKIKKGGKKRPNEEIAGGNEANKKPKTKKKQNISDVESSSSTGSRCYAVKNKKTKAEKAQEEVKALCSMFEDIEDFKLNTISTNEEELNKESRAKERESLLRQSISLMDQTYENTILNKTIPSQISSSENAMPPPKGPMKNRKVRFNANGTIEQNGLGVSEESAPSASTRSSGKIPTNTSIGCKNSHNVRYASEMKSKFIDTNKSIVVSVNVKCAKSPGWSHVEGARKDLKVRQASLNITGGEQRNMNDSRTETCGHSVNTSTSSQETDVIIDEETQRFDIEHLSSSQTKKERVKKLKEIVSQLQVEEAKKIRTRLQKSEKSRDSSLMENSENNKIPKTSQMMKSIRNKENSSTEDSLITKPPLPFSSETEPFNTNEHVDTLVSNKSVSSKSSGKILLQSLSAVGEKVKQKSSPTEHEDQIDKNFGARESNDTRISSRRTFSLTVNTQDLSVLQTNCESAGEPANVQQPDISSPPMEDIKRMSGELSNCKEPLGEVTIFTASSSTVVSKPCLPHHTMSPSSTSDSSSKTPFLPRSDPVEGNASSKMSQTSIPHLPSAKICSSDSQVIHSSKVVPFKSMGSLSSERRCGTAGDDAHLLTSAGGLGRDFCLHQVPCELYRVLMKYMALVATQKAEHRNCCCGTVVPETEKAVELTDIQEAVSIRVDERSGPKDQLLLQQCETKAERLAESVSSEKKNIKPVSQQSKELQKFHDSEVVPDSCYTEDMEVALPFPCNVGINTCARKDIQSKNALTQHVAKSSELNLDLSQKGLSKMCIDTKKLETKIEDLENDQTLVDQSIFLSSEIPLAKCTKKSLTNCIESSSSNQTQNTESSQQSTSLLALGDLSESKLIRTSRHSSSSSENVKIDEKPVEKAERRLQVAQKNKERGVLPRTVMNDEELVEVEKENLKNTGNLQLTINRPRRKPLQSGQPVLENIMSQVAKDGNIPPVEKEELTQIQNHRSQENQKTVILQNKPSNSKPLFSTESSNRSSRNKKDDLLTLSNNNTVENKDSELSGEDSSYKGSLESSKRRFKRTRRPANSDSSSEESDSEVLTNAPKRKSKVILSSSSNSSSVVQTSQKMNYEKPEHLLDSEEMRDLERFDQNIWEFFGQNSQIGMEVIKSQNTKNVLENEESAIINPSEGSDDEIPSTAEVMQNVNADLNLIKEMREKKKRDIEVITLTATQNTLPSASTTALSAHTKDLFTKVNKSLAKAEALLDEESTAFEDVCTSLDKRGGGRQGTPSDHKKVDRKSPSDKIYNHDEQDLNLIEESDHDPEDEVDSASHGSAYSTQSEAISTQKQKEVKDEVEMLKARIQELETALKKKDVTKAADDTTDVLPPTCPMEQDSGEESEELFSSLPEFTVSNEPKLPLTNDKKISQKLAPREMQSGTQGPPQLVCTGLSSLEIGKVQDFVNKLGTPGTSVKGSWNAGITHVIVKTKPDRMAQRTLKYLFGVAAGCWVISLQWVLDSLSSKALLPEEDYEVLDCSGVAGPNKGRVKPAALFTNCEFYVKPPFVDITYEELRKLIELCGARIVDSPVKFSDNQSLKLVVIQTDDDSDYEGMLKKYNKVCVAHDWILECIGMYAHTCITPYIIGNPTQSHVEASCLPATLLEETQEL